MEKIITFSIAAYNIELYATKLLDSFLNFDCLNEIEVLIINDGSQDNSIEIFQKYVENYPNTFKIINKKNGGHGSTINTGIQIATGKYFKPIDGDDWILTTNLLPIINQLKSIDADMVITNYNIIYENSKKTELINYNFLPKNVIFEFETIKWLDYIKYHSLAYKTSLLRENSIKFTENVFFDDTEFDLYPIFYVNKIIYIPEILYCYRLERIGQSVSADGIRKHIFDLNIILNNVFTYCKNLNNLGYQKKNYNDLLKRSLFYFFYSNTITKEWKIDKNLNKYHKQILHNLFKIDNLSTIKLWVYSNIILILSKIRKLIKNKKKL